MRKSVVPIFMLMAITYACVSNNQPRAAKAGADATSAVKARFQAGIEAFNRHDVDGFVDQFSRDVEMYTPTGWVRGSEAVRARFVETFAQFPNVRMETESLRARAVAPDTVVIDFAWRVFPMGKGPAFHGLSSGVYVLRDGRWVETLEHETVVKVDAPLPGART